VLESDLASPASGIAELVPVASPFGEDGVATEADIAEWIAEATDPPVDVLLLDYGGGAKESDVLLRTYKELKRRGVLLIAAGGNEAGEGPSYPAFHSFVLAVGALDTDGVPTPYSTWSSKAGKPEVFAYGTLASARAADLIPGDRQGTSFAALGALGAALLVWAVDRSLSAPEVRAILVQTAARHRVMRDGKRRVFRKLDVIAALARTRRGLIVRELRTHGPAGRQELLAATGLSVDVGLPILTRLVEDGTVAVAAEGRPGEHIVLHAEKET
jgi:hypothetical protein